jgi:tetratricopeptide (TPR) repeat protein
VELARGSVSDRPWALTLATVARRGVTGQITLVADGKRYSVAFDRGTIVAASSPMIADSVARVALTSHLISTTHVSLLQRRLAANPSADEVDLIGELANLSGAQLEKLRADVVIRRAARTFAPEQGEFIVEEAITHRAHKCAVDIRAVVYHGIRMHVSDARLASEIRGLGGNAFMLEPDVTSELHKFGFCDGEGPLLAALRERVTIPELEARHRDIDRRTMLAAIYALVACGAARAFAPVAPVAAPRVPVIARTPTPSSARIEPSHPHTLARGTRKSIPPPDPTKTGPELAAEAAERANRALASDKPEAAVLELKRAVELVPNNVDYNALLGWALFCAADDKTAVAAESRKLLEKAVYRSHKPENAQFYLGRVERILGRDKEALRHFHAVLDVMPSHTDASAEVRVIEARMKRLGRSKN